ncbi:MAG TPA: hypothetical protein VFJ19_07910, partial [Nocardioidaceae bacterium]|nr:hypothetical protein [Nocardioidaceae bacterium]
MPKSLSELQSSPDVGALERVADVCVAGKLVDAFDRVSADLVECRAEIDDLYQDAERRRERGGPPRRSGQPSRIHELEEKADRLAGEADELRGKIADHSVAVRLRADDGKWRSFKAAHPARDEQAGEDGARRMVDSAGYAEDARWTGGLCNAADLV